jgi:hypothetical protein
MRKSRFSDSQIMAILKKAESGVPVVEGGAGYLIRVACDDRRAQGTVAECVAYPCVFDATPSHRLLHPARA